jgi:hypothetical protein
MNDPERTNRKGRKERAGLQLILARKLASREKF